MRTVIWMIYFWLYLLLALPISVYLVYLEHTGRGQKVDRLVQKMVKNWARRLLWLAGAKVTVEGQENIPNCPAVYVGNHQGDFDVPLMLACVGLPRGFIAKAELAKLPGVATWMRHLHCLFLDRSSTGAGVQVMIDGEKLLKEGHSLTVFPEGTRSRGDTMRPFKAGAFRIASRVGAPIVPVSISGSYRLLEKNKGFHITPAAVKVTIHPPISTENLSREDIRAMPERVQKQIARAI